MPQDFFFNHEIELGKITKYLMQQNIMLQLWYIQKGVVSGLR